MAKGLRAKAAAYDAKAAAYDALLSDLREEVEENLAIAGNWRWHSFVREQRRQVADRLQAILDRHSGKNS